MMFQRPAPRLKRRQKYFLPVGREGLMRGLSHQPNEFPEKLLGIQISHGERVAFDELASRFDLVPHQR